MLKPTKKKSNLIEKNILEVQRNRVSIANKVKDSKKLSSKDFAEKLPSAVINQSIREVKALHRLFIKEQKRKVKLGKEDKVKKNIIFKKNQPICFNNQNYRIEKHFVSFPLYADKSRRYWFPLVKNDTFFKLKEEISNGAKLGKSSLFKKKGKYYLAVTVTTEPKIALGNNIMGIDIGLNQLAVASVCDKDGNEVSRAFFNGKEAGYVRRKHKAKRRSLGKAKKPNKIKAINDKESRYITNLNHKISRELVNLAVQEKVSTLVMEDLSGIRNGKNRNNKKADKNIHSWTFFELQQFIDYKAKMAGIKVVYVNPKYTSQTCSFCGIINKSSRKRNLYSCSCGKKVHADLNAARNIAFKKVKTCSSGNSLSA